MTERRLFTWVVPIALGVLTLILVAAVLIARQKRTPAAPPIASSQTVAPDAVPSHAPAFGAHTTHGVAVPAFAAQTTYGVGLTGPIRSPVPSLTPALGNDWRELGQKVGRVLVRPSGTPSRYFEMSVVAFAPREAARLEILTSEQERAIGLVRAGTYEVLDFGPLLSAAGGQRMGIALSSVQPHNATTGGDLLLSPLQSEYLAPGQAVMRMPALAEAGRAGSRGLLIAAGPTARFRLTPGVTGRCMVELRGEGIGGVLYVTIKIGKQQRSVLVGDRFAARYIGPFNITGGAESLTVRAAGAGGDLLVSSIRLVPSSPHGQV